MSLGKFLQKQPFADKINIKGTQDWGTTGNFDVIVGDTLIHSKTKYGQGRANTVEEQSAICNKIDGAKSVVFPLHDRTRRKLRMTKWQQSFAISE